MNVRHSRLARLVALTVVVSMPLLGMAGVASAKATRGSQAWCAAHPAKANKPICANATPGGNSGTGPVVGTSPDISVTVSPNTTLDPLVETGQSEIHAVVQVETLSSFAGDVVNISSSQLVASCNTLSFETIQAGLPPRVSPDNISVVLDDDGNVTVVVDGSNCAPGGSVVEADLESAPYLTALTTLNAMPPVTTTPGVVGFPNDEVETGDTTAVVGNGPSGNSDVYAVFYVEDNPVYAEATVEIDSTQLEARCGDGWIWEPGNGGTPVTQVSPGPGIPAGINTGPEPQTTLDDDGNAVFVFKGISCAAGDSSVIADVLAGTHDTFTFTYTIVAPQPTI